jgi:hypothetical protein
VPAVPALNAVCRVGVTSVPQHMQLELTPADKVLILASDGESPSSHIQSAKCLQFSSYISPRR